VTQCHSWDSMIDILAGGILVRTHLISSVILALLVSGCAEKCSDPKKVRDSFNNCVDRATEAEKPDKQQTILADCMCRKDDGTLQAYLYTAPLSYPSPGKA
jgi:hypothetical protein